MGPMKISPRSEKMAGVIQEVLPPILQQLVTPDQVGFLTVRAVEVSGDLGVTDIFVNAIGAPKGFLKKLNSVAPKVSYELAKVVPVRRTMQVRFKIDKSVQHVEKLGL